VALGRAGLEVLAGVPGTLGGIVRMNAGGRYGAIGDVIESVSLLTPEGAVEAWPAEKVGFAYRKTNLTGCVVLGAAGRLSVASPADVDRRYREIWTEKYRTQPPLAHRSSGCVFKNPGSAPAGRLIDEAGLKGERRGGAQISTRHANFIVATEGATAQDVLDLIALAQDRVRETAGVELQLEVEVW
jgi:UDP-N-acetylmuramate dehydrogenase